MLKKIMASFMAVCILISGIGTSETAYGKAAYGTSNTVRQESVSVQGNNSFGNLLAESINDKVDEQENNAGCNVFSADVSEKEVDIWFESTQDATLLAAVYNEAGTQMIASGKTQVQAGDTQAVVTIETETMPQYFYLRCFLVDGETLMPLCSSYESPNYTQEMQEFLAKTTEDFDQKQVVNLDDDTTNNFAVCGEETIVIPQTMGENVVSKADEEHNQYVIERIDENVSSLKSGDVFVYEYGEGEILILKVKTIQIDGDKAVITGAETSMEEVFSYVKLDGEASAKDATVDTSTLGEGVSYEGLSEYKEDEIQTYAWEGDGTGSFALSYKFADVKIGSEDNNIKLSGSLDLKLESSLKFYISLSYQYLELKFDYSGKLSTALSGNASGKIPIGYIGISPVPGVYIEFTPSLVAEASAKIEFAGKLKGTIGFSVSNDEGMKNLTSGPELKGEIKGEVTLFLGLSLEPEVKILSDAIAYAGLEAKVGGEIKAKMDIYKEPSTSRVHGCKQCVAGDISAKWEVKFDVKLLNLEKLKFTLKTGSSFKLTDFYYSFEHNSFDFTTCPYYRYRTTVTVTDEKGNKLENAKIAASFYVSKEQANETVTSIDEMQGSDFIMTGSDGKAVGYLTAGNHKLTITADEYSTSRQDIFVKDEAKDI